MVFNEVGVENPVLHVRRTSKVRRTFWLCFTLLLSASILSVSNMGLVDQELRIQVADSHSLILRSILNCSCEDNKSSVNNLEAKLDVARQDHCLRAIRSRVGGRVIRLSHTVTVVT